MERHSPWRARSGGCRAAKRQPDLWLVRFSADADIDKPLGLVQLTHIAIESVDVPTRPDAAAEVKSALVARLPPSGLTVPLDELQASYAVSQHLKQAATVTVKNDVPRILFASTHTVLVLVDGDPVWRSVSGTHYERALNTRALLLRVDGKQYLLI